MNKSTFIWVLSIMMAVLVCFGAGCGTHVPNPVGDGELPTVAPEVLPDQGDSGEAPGESEPFIPGIFDDDPKVEIGGNYDFSTIYDYSAAVLTDVDGMFTVGLDENGSTYTASTARALSVNKTVPFPYGTMSADVTTLGSDTGIVFGLSSNKNSFWEGSGIRYYFFFVSLGGSAYLGKASNGGWSALAEKKISGFNGSTTYNIKIVYKGNKILCFLNGEHVISYSDADALPGTGWGVRAGAQNAVIKNVQISSQFDY